MTSPGEGPAPFATNQDLVNAWRPLTGEEMVWSAQLLDAAALRIREKWLAQRGTPIPDDHPGAATVSISVVKNAMAGGAFPNQVQFKTVVGGADGWEESGTLANPGGELTFDEWHWAQLGLRTKALPAFHFADQDY